MQTFPSSPSPTTPDDLGIANTFRRLSKWHFQTKPLPAWNAGTHLPSPLASKSSSLPGELPTNPGGVLKIGRLVRASSEEAPTGHLERCIQSYAISAGLTLRFPLFPVVTDRCTVAIASAKRGPRSLAGKPLAGFRATPDRRIIVLCGMIVSVIRFKNPLLHR